MIRLENVGVSAGTFRLRGIELQVPSGAYAVLMGRTGSGKTSLLEAICGLRKLDGGSIYLEDREVTHLRPGERGIGYVPQDAAIFETMTVRDNLAFAPSIHGWEEKRIEEKVSHLAGVLGIDHLLDRKPLRLSGGEAQRVALGRALAVEPRVLCLDEPLSALDEETRAEIQQLLRSIRRHWPVTVLHVTHHSADAESLADLVFVLREGRISIRSK